MGALKSIHGESMGGLKMLSKNICEGIHLIVKLLAVSLQACKFTKNELFHTYFWRILARFYVIYCAFSRNHFMEGCFLSQWGEGVPHRGHRFWWGFRKGHPHAPSFPHALCETMGVYMLKKRIGREVGIFIFFHFFVFVSFSTVYKEHMKHWNTI